MNIEFSAEIWYWHGPAPWYFVTVPDNQCQDLRAMSALVTYGWGMIPALVRIGKTEWKTSLFPKDGLYIVPIKASVGTRFEATCSSGTVSAFHPRTHAESALRS